MHPSIKRIIVILHDTFRFNCMHVARVRCSAYVSVRQHTSEYVSIRQQQRASLHLHVSSRRMKLSSLMACLFDSKERVYFIFWCSCLYASGTARTIQRRSCPRPGSHVLYGKYSSSCGALFRSHGVSCSHVALLGMFWIPVRVQFRFLDIIRPQCSFCGNLQHLLHAVKRLLRICRIQVEPTRF